MKELMLHGYAAHVWNYIWIFEVGKIGVVQNSSTSTFLIALLLALLLFETQLLLCSVSVKVAR